MKKTYKLIILLIISIAIISLVSFYMFSASYSKDYNERYLNIQNSYDNRLSELNKAQEIAKSYLEIYTINNKEKYNDVKALLYDNLDKNMKIKFDLFEDNIKLSNKSFQYSIFSIFSSMKNESDLITFKIHYTLFDGQSTKGYVTYVTLKDNLVVSADNYVLEIH